MKKIVFFSIVALLCSYGFAQKPVKGDKGFSFGLSGAPNLGVNTKNSPTGSLNFKYVNSDKWTTRFGFRYGNKNSKTKSDTTGNGIDTTNILKTYQWALNLGFQHSLGKIQKLDPYVGAELFYGKTGGSYDSKIEVVSPINPNSFGDYIQLHTADFGKGRVSGIRIFTGFNYFFTDHMAVGAEFGYGFQSVISKNGTTSVNINGNSFGAQGISYFTNSASNAEKDFNTLGSGIITFSVYF